MRRFIVYSLLLMAVNAVCQAALALLTRTIDLQFGAFAGLVLIPITQSAILVLASPPAGESRAESLAGALRSDRIALGAAVVPLLGGALLARASDEVWRGALASALVVAACLSVACLARVSGRGVLAFASGALIALAFAADAAFRALRRMPERFDTLPDVIVLAATYVPLFVLTIVVLLGIERSARGRCAPAGRMLEAAVAFVIAGSLVVAGNYFHHPMISEGWMPVVRASECLALACVLAGEAMFLRHERGAHATAA